jgi:hypothetical protein
MNLLSYIKGNLFFTGGNFCNLDNFISELSYYAIGKNINSREAFIERTKGIIDKITLELEGKKIGETEAKLMLMSEDLETLLNTPQFHEIDFDLEKQIETYYNEFRLLYEDIGIEVGDIPCFIVEDYPKPYSHLKGAALCPDKSDEMKFNITPGVYFRKDKLIPIQSALTLAHEMVHFIAAQNGHELLARGLEEGLCEFLGIAYCGRKVFGINPPLNYMIYRRLKYTSHKQKFKLYMDYFRFATYIYLKYGFEGIVYLINKGRTKIKETEIVLSNMEFDAINLPGKQIDLDEDLCRFSSYISLLFAENEVVSPLSYWISKNIGDIRRTDEIIEKLNLDPDQAKKAIKDIEGRIFGILLDETTIEYSDLSTILKLKNYRYEI